MDDTRDETGSATVRLAARRWFLRPGEELTFGRHPGRDIRFAYDPEDDWVSRQAGTLIGLADGVLIRNDSQTQGIVLQSFPGPETPIGPRMTVGTAPHDQVRLVVPGRHGTRYALIIDTRPLLRHPPDGDADTPVTYSADTSPTNPLAARVTARELRLLIALCEPMMILAGEQAVPATYREIGERVGQKPGSVRNCLDALRQRLSDEDGVPGLRNADEGDRGDYRAALARWALSSATVRPGQLRLLEPDRPDG